MSAVRFVRLTWPRSGFSLFRLLIRFAVRFQANRCYASRLAAYARVLFGRFSLSRVFDVNPACRWIFQKKKREKRKQKEVCPNCARRKRNKCRRPSERQRVSYAVVSLLPPAEIGHNLRCLFSCFSGKSSVHRARRAIPLAIAAASCRRQIQQRARSAWSGNGMEILGIERC